MYVGYVKIRRTFSVSFCPTKFKLLSLLRYVESSVKYENDFGFVFVFVCLFVFVVVCVCVCLGWVGGCVQMS